jgi:hypothetical protein
MTTTDTDDQQQAEREVCLYPGCENLAVEGPKTAVQGRTGPPPRYCELEEHNASSTFLEIKRLEDEKAAGGDAA